MSAFAFEQKLQAVSAEGPERAVVGAVVVANDVSGKLQYVATAGTISSEPGAPALKPDTTFWIASCTKLMTTIAALQCVERGLFTLDEDISRILPEWKDPDIITGFDEGTGKPILVKAKNKITLRRMLSHQSGFGYDIMHPLLMRLRERAGERQKSLSADIEGAYRLPLLFEPGESWMYGCGIDWAGQMVERTNGNIRLGDYMKKHIWGPLGMNLTTFRVAEHDEVRARLVKITARLPEVGLVPDPPLAFPAPDPKDDEGGAGAYAAATDYIKILTSLLKDDGKLLKPETVKEMFAPQLGDGGKYMKAVLQNPELAAIIMAGMPTERNWNWGLGGMIVLDGIPGRASPGTMFWGGLPNLFWSIDRGAGLCSMYASQLIPPGDPQSAALYDEFQRELFGKSAKL